MKLRKLLYPFSVLYAGVTRARNMAYDRGWKTSSIYDIPIICVGNLSVGGTGKSPMVEWLLSFLAAEYQVAVLSRGYGRTTKGYLEVAVFCNVAIQQVQMLELDLQTQHPHLTS